MTDYLSQLKESQAENTKLVARIEQLEGQLDALRLEMANQAEKLKLEWAQKEQLKIAKM